MLRRFGSGAQGEKESRDRMHSYRHIAAAAMVCLCAPAAFGGEIDFSLGAGDEEVLGGDAGVVSSAEGLAFELSEAPLGDRDDLGLDADSPGGGATPSSDEYDPTGTGSTPQAVPAPTAALLAGAGLAGLAAGRRRR